MYTVLHELLMDRKGGKIFTLFGTWHFLYMIATALVILGAMRKLKNSNEAVRERTVRRSINLAFVLYILDIFLMPLAYGEIDIEKLPFHACTAMCVTCFLAERVPALKPYRMSFVMLGFLSNLVYLVYPAGVMWHGVHPLSYRVIQTLTFHSLMTIYGFLALVYGKENICIRKNLLVILGMTIWAMLGNYAYNGTSEGYSHFFNWFFVVRDPFYILPEAIAPYVMPALNVLLFFGVEMIICTILQKIKCKSAQ